MPRWLKDGDVYASLALIALGAFILSEAAPWSFYTPDGPGPAMFPRIYGVAMIGLSLCLLSGKLAQPRPAAANDTPVGFAGTARALATLAAFAATVAAMGYAGFMLPFAIFTFFLVLVVFRRSFVAALATAVLIPAAFYVTFTLLLGVQLPTGLVGF